MAVKTALAGCSPVFTVPVVLLLLSFHWSYVQSTCLSSCPSNACTGLHNPNAGYCANANYVRTTSQQTSQGSELYQGYYYTRCGFLGWKRCRRYRYQYRSVTIYRAVYQSTLRCSTSCCRGYSGSGTNCQPVCSPSCSNGGTCTAPSTCSCTPQWTGSTCATDVNECIMGTDNCEQRCSNTRGGFTCSCNTGYQLSGNGYQCRDVNECTAGTDNCEQLCTNTRGSFTCSCNTGYRLLGNRYQCQAVCTSPCRNGGTCSRPNTCTCTSEWTGSTCTIPVCTSPCQNGGSCSAPDTCTCTSEWTGSTCTTPPPSSVSISGMRTIVYKSTLTLTCSASGTVKNYKWYLNNTKLTTTKRRYIKSSAQQSDSGSYQCRACNPAGCTDYSSSRTVVVIDIPDAVDVSTIEATNTTVDTISIQWTPPNNNFDSIIDYRVVLYGSGGLVGVFTSSQPMVTLVSLQPFTTYQIRISARNNAGWGGNSSERNVNTLTRDEALASNVTYSTHRVGVSAYTVELKWVVPIECLTDKLEGYRLSRWPTNATDIETTTVNRDNVSCAWNVTAIGSETYCHEWEGFGPGSQYTVSLEIVYNYGILSTGSPTNVTITIPTLPLSQEDIGTVDLALGVVMGALLAVLVTVVAVLVALLICKKCRCSKTKETDTAAVYSVNDYSLETVRFEPAYGGDHYTLTDDHQYANEHLEISKDSHCASKDRVTSQKQPYTSLGPKSAQTSAYASLVFNQNSSTPNARSTAKYENSTNTTNEYDTPNEVVPQKKPSTQQTNEYANWNVIIKQHGEGDQRSVDRKSSNKIPSTSGPGVKEVGKETTAPRKSQIFASDVTMPTKKEDIGDTHHLTLPKKHEQREKVPPPTKQRPKTNKKQPLLPPTQQSATPKPQTCPQQPDPVMTGSPSDVSLKPPIPPKAKKQPLLPKKVHPEQSAVTKQPPQTCQQQPDPVMTGSPSDVSTKPPIATKAKKQPLLPKKVPPEQSAVTKQPPQTRPQQPNPVMTGSPSDVSPKPPIASKAKKQPLLPKKVPPEQSAVTNQPLPGSNVTELRKKLENKYSVN